MSEPIRVEVASADKGRRYSATVVGESEPLASGSRDPEHDACRALVARGYVGAVTFLRNGTPSMRVKDVQRTAGKTIEEGPQRGPLLTKWRPVPDFGRPAQGASSPLGVGEGTSEPDSPILGDPSERETAV